MTPEKSSNYQVFMDGSAVMVYHTTVADYAILCFRGDKTLEVRIAKPFETLAVRPIRKDRVQEVAGNTLTLKVSDKDRLSVEPYGLTNPLYILCSQPIPQPENATHVYKTGTVTEVGQVTLLSGDCVYMEEGAIVVGCFQADKQSDIIVTGNGILWGSPLHGKEAWLGKPYMLQFIQCNRVHLSGITLVDGPSWHVVPVACNHVTIQGLNIITIVMSGDGIDVVGCEDVNISHCFIRTNDDCIVVKANRYRDPRGCKDAKRITARDCVLWKDKCGNAVEIGYETSAEEICDVLFEDIDIIHCQFEGWQSGGVFTIHNGDRAHVHHITYRDIRIENAEEKLVDFKILTSKYSVDKWRGKISDILLENIHVCGKELPPSIIRGYESDAGEPELVKNITIRNLYLNDVKILSSMQAHMITELSENITFC